MTAEQLMAGIGFIIMLGGAAWGVWWRVQGQIDKVETEAFERGEKAKSEAIAAADLARAAAALAQMQLAEHRLHVAETYVTKAGLREATEHIMHAIKGVQQSVEGLGGRLDRVFEQRRHDGERS